MSLAWQAVEALGAAYFIEQGYAVLVPFGDSPYYDFLVEKDGHCKRVNVKKANCSCGSWRISLPRKRHADCAMKTPEVDCYLVYVPAENLFIELGGEFFVGNKSHSKVVPMATINKMKKQRDINKQD